LSQNNRIQQSPSGPIRANSTIQDGVNPGDAAIWDGTQWIPDQSALGAGLVLWSWRYNLKRTGHITRRSNAYA
jgi:hypothetical protein